jgi:hypothetical protein
MKFKLNGKPLNIPTSWDEVTYGQYLQMIKLEKDDPAAVIGILTGIESDVVRKAQIVGLEQILIAVRLLRTESPDFTGKVTKVGKYTIPVNGNGEFNIKFESLEQFEDMRSVMLKTANNPKSIIESYGEYVAIYLQKFRDGVYDAVKAEAMIETEIKAMPAKEVLAAGTFFLVKLLNLLPGTAASSLPTNPPPNKVIGKRSKKSSKGRTRR